MTPAEDGGEERDDAAGTSQGSTQAGAGPGIVRRLAVHRTDNPAEWRSSVLPLRVLIADDYADAAESFAVLLSNAGIETATATDGADALVWASRWRPHVCVLDIDMPTLDGLEIARRIRAQGWVERPLLIALTGWTQPQGARAAMEAGFDHFIVKPAEPLQLVRIIQDYLVAQPR